MADASSSLRVPANANSSEHNPAPVAEAPSSNPTPQAAATAVATSVSPPETPRRRRKLTRPILFALLPVALAVGGYYYVTGGQIMSTDNAYIQADMVGVSTDVSGTVISVDVHENEVVKKGQVLFRLKPDSFRIALEGAQAQLGNARNQILNLQASYKQSLAEIAQAQADLPYYQTEFERQQNLINSSVASRAAFDQAKHNLEAAQQKVSVAQAQAATTLAQLGGENSANLAVEQNPLYLQAKAAVDNAQRELDDTVVRAPFDGVTANVPSLQVGAYLTAAQQGFSLVSTTHMWISASPKETELTYVRTGQMVTISVDAYPGVTWKGTVASIAPASGSSFSLLPAQNTTGNWVKVVQRIPMIISIDDTQGKPPLRVGMSVVADVDTGHARGLPDFIASLLGHSRGQDHE
ncbi:MULTISPECIES: HlyD family secretion protein [Rhizobium]|uniref:Membrane fusion protein, multidrug efflux system n=1 Tax=Rhizobium miluonense TaxID=411945 RepID=A0A1C3WPN0_9HYPH|nr:HlyD family secretion protein [Rhizobium miluonense]SCB41875.1 membrane fusion protein, multidrug efflux system [Rhizobium miluonense]